MRHAPTSYSEQFLVNGDPTIKGPLTADSGSQIDTARDRLPIERITTWVTSSFPRCRRTTELIIRAAYRFTSSPTWTNWTTAPSRVRAFLDYALWLAETGPGVVPPGARETQAAGVTRMLDGLVRVLDTPPPRVVVAHGLLVSVVIWAQANPRAAFNEVFLPAPPTLVPVVLDDTELRSLAARMTTDPSSPGIGRRWHVDGRYSRERSASTC